MKNRNWDPYLRWGITAFAVIAAGASVVFFILHLRDVRAGIGLLLNILKPVVYGAVMAYLLAPVYNRSFQYLYAKLKKSFPSGRAAKSISKAAATVISTALLCLVAGGLVSMILPEIYKSVMNVFETMPANVNALYDWLQKALEDPQLRTTVLSAYDSVTSFVEGYVQNTLLPDMQRLIGSVSVGIWNAVMWLKDVLIGVIVMMYLLNIKEMLVGQARKLIFACAPKNLAQRLIQECERINRVFSGFIIGKLLDSLIIGIMCFVILGFMDMPYTMLVSVIVGVTNIIPFFGPFIGAIPSFVLILLVNPLQSLYFLIFILLLQQFDGNVLGPKILGDSTGISSFWVLFSILLFGGLFGFVGMIIAVPTWAVFLNLTGRFANRLLRKKQLPTDSRTYLNQEEAERR